MFVLFIKFLPISFFLFYSIVYTQTKVAIIGGGIIYPFLGASLGTCESEIKHTSAYEIVSLFAFRKAKASNLFYILKDGMGKLIQQIGEKLASKGVSIKTSAPVVAILKDDTKYQIHYTEANTKK